MPSIADAVEYLVEGAKFGVNFVVIDRMNGNGPQIAEWELPGDPPTPQQIAAVTDQQVTDSKTAKIKETAKALYDDTTDTMRVLRAVVQILVKENNDLREWCMGLKAGADSATNLAQFRASILALPNLPSRDSNDARNAIRNAVDSETAQSSKEPKNAHS